MLVQTTALLALAAAGSAHMIMQNPAPFVWEDSATQQSPLSMADFPCKQPSGAYKVDKMNKWNAGETNDVKLIGGATHGGGSCQFSITTDTKPTKESQWKVIHSVIGGCPGGPPDNNLSGDKNDASLPAIPVKMPENTPPGQYTFAWSWVNKIGQREFYMNCAPIQVGSASGAKASSADVSSALGALPDMFTINLGQNAGCSTTEGEDFQYPNPGDSVVQGPQAVPGSKTTGANCDTITKMGAGKGSLGSPSQGDSPTQPEAPASSDAPPAASSNPAPPAQAPTSAAKPTATGQPGGVFAPGASSGPAAQPTAPAAPTAQPSAQPTAVQPPAAPSNGTPPQGSSDCTPCTEDGAVVCIGTNQFGLCNRGCAVPQALAAGMACTNGAITGAVKRRHVHVPRAHLRKFVH